MSLSILIETMRREGYEFQVSPARVLYKEIDGVKCEPIERLVVTSPATAWVPSSKSWASARPTCWR